MPCAIYIFDGKKLALLLSILVMMFHPIGTVRAISLLDMATASVKSTNSLFNSSESKYNSFEGLPNWARVIKRSPPEISRFIACANNKQKCETSEQRAWRKFIIPIMNLPRDQKIMAVNRFFNKWTYKPDHDVYGVDDYWASLSQFMENSGDCEDYAIAKFYTLMALGFKDAEMRIVALTIRTENKGHVVLAIYEKDNIQILDNLTDTTISHKILKNYTPIYSVNQTSRWVHIPANISVTIPSPEILATTPAG